MVNKSKTGLTLRSNKEFLHIYQNLWNRRKRRGLNNESTYQESKILFDKKYGYENQLNKLLSKSPPVKTELSDSDTRFNDPLFKHLYELTSDRDLKRKRDSRVIDTIF